MEATATMLVLSINTYGGSLLLGARAGDHEIVGSLEDGGYGSDLQEDNFPDVEIVRSYPWGDRDLRETVVIAHPPCAAFSNQNQGNPARRGTDAPKFKCTEHVLDYAMRNKAPAIAIESVPGALKGAEEVHKQFATEYRYNLYRVTQNACQFGLAQWRPRFWAIWVKASMAPPAFVTWLPRVPNRFMHEVMAVGGRQTLIPNVERDTGKQVEVLRREAPSVADEILEGAYGYGLIDHVAERVVQTGLERKDIQARFSIKRGFASHHMRLLDPLGYSCTIMSDSWLYCGRTLCIEEYCDIMGFPRDYYWGRYQNRFREYLSRGVCPPVAKWILELIQFNLYELPEFRKSYPGMSIDAEFDINQKLEIQGGQIADYAAIAVKPKGDKVCDMVG